MGPGRRPSTCLLGLHYEHGGLAHHVENLAGSLSRLVPTEVVALRPERGALADLPEVKYRALPVVMERWRTIQGSLLCAAASATGMLTDADVIHAHHPLSAALVRATSPRKCVIQTVHHIPSLDLSTMGAGARRTRLAAAARTLERYCWPRLTALIVVHRELADWIIGNLPVASEAIRVIPNGVDTQRFRPDPEAGRAIRRKLALPEDTFIGLCMKTLHKDDLSTVLRAAAAVDDPRFRLLIPWRDPTISVPELVREAGARNVVLADPIPYSETPGYYSGSDLILVPYLKREYNLGAAVPAHWPDTSLRELCRAGYASVTSLTAMEALASGTPTIVSVPGARSRADRTDIATAVPAWDHVALAEAVREILDDPGPAGAMAQNARRFVGEEFTWDKIAERTVALYRAVFS